METNAASGSSDWVDRIFLYDGGGSVRALTDLEGNVTDTFNYDSFGNLLQPSSLNLHTFYFYRGERWDNDLGQYYLRARFYDANLGRFHTLDEYEGRTGEPLSLHKYLYAHGNPVSGWDPSGRMALASVTMRSVLMGYLAKTYCSTAIILRSALGTGLQAVKLMYATWYLPTTALSLEQFAMKAYLNGDLSIGKELMRAANLMETVYLKAVAGALPAVAASIALGPIGLLINVFGVGCSIFTYGKSVVEGVSSANSAAGIVNCKISLDPNSDGTKRLIVDLLLMRLYPAFIVDALSGVYEGGKTGNSALVESGRLYVEQNFCSRYR